MPNAATKVTADTVAFTDREDWLDERKKGIGGSDSPVLMGLSPWKSPLELWAEKTGKLENKEPSAAMKWGNRLESSILDGFRQDSGFDVSSWSDYVIHFDMEDRRLICTPDGFIEADEPGLVQIKNVGAHQGDKWVNEAPLMYQAQVQHEMAATGLNYAYIVALIGGQDLRWVRVERNENYINVLRLKVAEFWKYVETDTEPPYSEDGADAEAIAKLHPQDNGVEIELKGLAALPDSIKTLKERRKELDASIKKVENEVKTAIGQNTFGKIPGVGVYSWKTVEVKEAIRKAYTFRRLHFKKERG